MTIDLFNLWKNIHLLVPWIFLVLHIIDLHVINVHMLPDTITKTSQSNIQRSVIKHQENMSMKCIPPHTPLWYAGVYLFFFFYLCSKRLNEDEKFEQNDNQL